MGWGLLSHCISLQLIVYHCIPLQLIVYHCIPLPPITSTCTPLHLWYAGLSTTAWARMLEWRWFELLNVRNQRSDHFVARSELISLRAVIIALRPWRSTQFSPFS